ncbi:hypothetical protein [Parasediminibacterium sp. JCM 36343]|uniref:hypothetical protein n=1 Tax=Parasediminibacterium sp. JCM 36343 TaxID=3374279 RepID=UPI003979E343
MKDLSALIATLTKMRVNIEGVMKPIGLALHLPELEPIYCFVKQPQSEVYKK